VAIEEKNSLKAMPEEVFGEFAQQIEVEPGRSGDRAREIGMVVRIAQPLQGSEEHASTHRGLRAAYDFRQ
jgi:hypothetical protein